MINDDVAIFTLDDFLKLPEHEYSIQSQKEVNGELVTKVNTSFYNYSFLGQLLHSFDDMPSLYTAVDSVCAAWHKQGLYHREYGPAYYNGEEILWYLDGEEIELMRDQEEILDGFDSLKNWIDYINLPRNVDETYQLIHDNEYFFELLTEPTAKQLRVHQMAHLL